MGLQHLISSNICSCMLSLKCLIQNVGKVFAPGGDEIARVDDF